MGYITLNKKQLLDSLEHQARFSELPAVVIGERGLGKTFIFHQLQNRLGGEVQLAPINAKLDLSLQQLEKTLRLQLGVPWQETKQSLLEGLTAMQVERAAILIDDAHLLSENCLHYLLSLVIEAKQSDTVELFLLLLGEAQVASKLAETEALKAQPDLCVVFELEPFAEQETKSLIAEFQGLDTSQVDKLYPQQRQDYFYQLCEGNPGDLKEQLERWSQAHPADKKAAVKIVATQKIQWWVLGLLATLIATITSYFFIFGGMETSPQDIAVEHAADSPAEAPPLSAARAVKKKQKRIQQEPAEKTSVAAENDRIEKALSEQSTMAKDDNPVVEQSKEAYKRTIEQARISEPKVESASESAGAIKPVEKITLRKTSQEDNVKSTTASDSLSGNEWLAAQNSTHFVLQWAALSHEGAAREFVSKHQGQLSLHIVAIKRNGRTLFSVLSGPYDSKSAALAFADSHRIDGIKPWPKPISVVQQQRSQP